MKYVHSIRCSGNFTSRHRDDCENDIGEGVIIAITVIFSVMLVFIILCIVVGVCCIFLGRKYTFVNEDANL